MNKIVGTECHPDGLTLDTEFLCCLARLVLPVWDLSDTPEPLFSEVHQHDVLRH